MIELFAYKLFNNYIKEFVPEIEWLDLYADQFNKEGEERPMKGTSCFIQIQPRNNITTSQKVRNDGQMEVTFHLTSARSDNYSTRKKNINETLHLQSTASKFNKFMNACSSAHYPENSIYRDSLLIEATNVYSMNVSNLISVENTFNDKFQIISLTYLFEYSDASAYTDITFIENWSYDIKPFISQGGSFNDDYSTNTYDVRTDVNQIWYESVNISGSTVTIKAHSFKQGIPVDLNYGIINNDYQAPDYLENNEFDLVSGEYWVYILDNNGVGLEFPANPITIS